MRKLTSEALGEITQMDPISTTSTVFETVGIFTKGKRLWLRYWGAPIAITDPHNRDSIDKQQWVPVKGTHANPRGEFWLLTRDGKKFWPQNKIKLDHDGFWRSSAHVGTEAVGRSVTIVLARVWDFGDSVFEDYKHKRGGRTNWEPIELQGYGKEFKIVQEIVINVPGSQQGGQPTNP